MAGELILDTGPLVAMLDASQDSHDSCVSFFADWIGPVLTTEAVLTEATHLLASARGGPAACLDFFLDGGAILVPPVLSRIERVRGLVRKYADVPMDYADGTLVSLAEEFRTENVFTLDFGGFSVYRWNRRRKFRIYP